MVFRELKQNGTIYVLNCSTMELERAIVSQISAPKIDINKANGQTGLFVDITTKIGGKDMVIATPDGCSTIAVNGMILGTSASALIPEVEAMRNNAQRVLDSVEENKAILAKADELLQELDPAIKAKAENESRMSKMENSIGKLEAMFEKLLTKLGND